MPMLGLLPAGRGRQRRVHHHEPEAEHPASDRGLRVSFEDRDSQVRRGRAHGQQALLQQLVAAGVLPVVAAARHLRGLLPQRQRPVRPGDHVAVRLPDQRPELHRDRRAAVRLPRRHPLPGVGSATARSRPIGRTSSRCTATTRELGPQPWCWGAVRLGHAADRPGRQPVLRERGRDSRKDLAARASRRLTGSRRGHRSLTTSICTPITR